MTTTSTRKQAKTRDFPFLTEEKIRTSVIDLTKFQSSQLRKSLQKGVYWVQLVERGRVHWNVTLLRDYVIYGDRPEHQSLIEEYIKTTQL